MKRLIVLIFTLLVSYTYAQDLIILRNGDEIKAKVTEILSETVKYKRYSNQTGPTYSIDISEIFMIRYESGDKDVFGHAGDSNSHMVMDNNDLENPTEFVYDSYIGDPYCQIKKPFGGRVYGDRGNEIFYRQDMVFYGFDMTYLKLSNIKKINNGVEIVQDYYEDFHDVLANHILPFKDIRYLMEKQSMFLGKSVFPNYRYMNYQDFVVAGSYCIPFEDLKKIVKSYVLTEKAGVGMVIVLENFNKDREYSLIWVTFFDIATREILFAAEVSGKAGGSGMAKHWDVGVEVAFKKMFIDNIYKPRRVNNYQIPEKLLFY
jgi:hypothetical protein